MERKLFKKALEASSFLKEKIEDVKPQIALVLGSGLRGVSDSVKKSIEIPYFEIPYFCRSTVEGHSGVLISGQLGGIDILMMSGRFHFYEGYTLEEVTFPVRVFSLMGIKTMVLTNAAGSTNTQMKPESLMVITDHLYLMGVSPLRGSNDDRFGPRFPDMSRIYTPDLIDLAHEAARESGIALYEGVYAGVQGPNYETPAEVRMLRGFGADAIGMSTVPEAVVARQCGMKVLAFSCITNIAAGLTRFEINHDEVLEVGARAGKILSQLLIKVIPRLTE